MLRISNGSLAFVKRRVWKNQDHSTPHNYRPISLKPGMSGYRNLDSGYRSEWVMKYQAESCLSEKLRGVKSSIGCCMNGCKHGSAPAARLKNLGSCSGF